MSKHSIRILKRSPAIDTRSSKSVRKSERNKTQAIGLRFVLHQLVASITCVDDLRPNRWQNLSLSGEEGAKLTLLLLNTDAQYDTSINEATFYGDDVQTLINLAGGTSKVINIDADIDNAVAAKVRIAIAERDNIWNESFDVVVNGNTITVPAERSNGFDDDNRWLFSREVEVPLEHLVDGNNEVFVDFNSNGGQLVTASLIISTDLNPTNLLGDFDGDGDVDLADLDQYNGNLGASPTGTLTDLDLDGDIDADDFMQHYSQLVETSNGGKGTFAGDLNLDGTVNVLGDTFALVGNLGNSVSSWGQGDFNTDGTVNVLGDAFALVGNLGNTNDGSGNTSVSEVPY